MSLKKTKSIIRSLWISAGFIVILIIVFFWMIANGVLGFMPTFEELENPKSFVASQIITSDKQVLGKFYKNENRTLVEYKDLSPFLVKALIATEDERFYRHPGIDLQGLGRVAKGILTGNTSSGGGSTISQQLAKLLFPRESNSGLKLAMRKLREWVIAVKLERSYTKEEIITMYLNKFEFIYDAFGIEVASKTYFNTTPDKLKIEQAATLVGMLKNPYLYNPNRSKETSLQRRNVVLKQMQKNGYLKKAEYDSLKNIPLNVDFQRDELKRGLAPFFRKYLEKTMIAEKPDRSDYKDNARSIQKWKEDSTAWASDPLYGWCNKNHKQDGEPYDLYKDGLKIYTTVSYKMQEYAEEAVELNLRKLQPQFDKHIRAFKNYPFSNDLTDEQAQNVLWSEVTRSERYRDYKKEGYSKDKILREFNKLTELSIYTWDGYKDTIMSPMDSIKYYLKHLSSSFMAMDPRTGEVKAWVGGSAYGFTEIDMVRSSTFKRQVGSTCKPFLYTLAMQNGLSPCKMVPNIEQTFILGDGTTWTAKNSSKTKKDGDMVTLRWGLANSVNQISAWIMKRYTPEAMRDVMRQLGIYSEVPAVPSMFLGTAEITLYEMVAAYGVFANRGVYSSPIVVSRIEDKYGNLISTFQSQHRDALDEKTAYLMTNLLQGVVREGSGGRLMSTYETFEDYGGFTTPFAGKTGTTQNQSDGWFVGFTPELVAGVWSGANYRSIHFEDLTRGQGSNMALPIFGRFFKQVFADPSLKYKSDFVFEQPDGFDVDIDCGETGVSTEKSKPDYDEYF